MAVNINSNNKLTLQLNQLFPCPTNNKTCDLQPLLLHMPNYFCMHSLYLFLLSYWPFVIGNLTIQSVICGTPTLVL